MKKRLGTIILFIIMIFTGIATIPTTEIGDQRFWIWLTILLLATILLAMIFLGEDPFELFDMINKENFKKSPVFGILAIPFVIALGGLVWSGMVQIMDKLSNLIK